MIFNLKTVNYAAAQISAGIELASLTSQPGNRQPRRRCQVINFVWPYITKR